jgi:hypothetical protein
VRKRKRGKRQVLEDRERHAMTLATDGRPLTIKDIAARSHLSEQRVRRLLGTDRRLTEGATMNDGKIRQMAEQIKYSAERRGVDLEEYAQAAALAADLGGAANSSGDGTAYERKVKARTAQLAQERAVADRGLEQEAIEQLVNSGEVPLWEEPPAVRPTERARALRVIDRRMLAEGGDDFEQKVRRLMDAEGLDRMAAVNKLANKGEIAF